MRLLKLKLGKRRGKRLAGRARPRPTTPGGVTIDVGLTLAVSLFTVWVIFVGFLLYLQALPG
jgi:hypothetical protein